MYRRTFTWGNSKPKIFYNDKSIETLWVFGLLLAALLLFGINLGVVPLRDWDEGTVAQVAREIWQAPANSLRWLYPTLGGVPYFNKPPLMHLLIATAYRIGGANEWTARLPGAILTAISVPLLYGIGREIFKNRTAAIFAALIYLTLLPVVRHGRLAMLDGAVLCFFIFMIWCVLKSRRDLRWALGVGIGLGLICLTKGMIGLLLGAIAFIFIAWDTPRLLFSSYLWLGLVIGSAPVSAWYAAQLLRSDRSQLFLSIGLWQQSAARIVTSVENHQGPVWYYLLEILKYVWPWLLFCPSGLKLAWQNRNLSWAKLVLVWFGFYLLAISLMGTKLPWYIFPIYPSIALAGGAYLAEVCNWPNSKSYPPIWVVGLTLLGFVTFAGSLYFGGITAKIDWQLHLTMLAAAVTFIVAAFLVVQRDLQFIYIVFWGTYVSLLLFITSPHWVWELNEAYPVKSVAAMLAKHSPVGQPIYTSFPYGRPSLNFYSDRQVIPASNLKEIWENKDPKNPQPYFLIEEAKFNQLDLKHVNQIAKVDTLSPVPIQWLLITPSN